MAPVHLSKIFVRLANPAGPFDKATPEPKAVGGGQNQTAFLGDSTVHQQEEDKLQDMGEEDHPTIEGYDTTTRCSFAQEGGGVVNAQVKVAGGLSLFKQNWQQLSRDSWILQVVSGYQIEFWQYPYQE